jgi:predicted metal-binding membrane protein
MSSTPLEVVLKRDRLLILGGLVIISALAWGYLYYQAHAMQQMDMGHLNMGGMDMPGMDMSMSMAMPQTHSWGAIDLFLIFVMWAVMMIAMMVPTAGPMVLLFATFNRKRREQERPFVPTSVFLLGYLAIWIGFSVIASIAQWSLHRAALLSPMMISTSPVLGGSLLVAAGIFQWTPLKNTCLTHCRSPLDFFSSHWREGNTGAFNMGLHHGVYCIGCCWVLMALLFVAGVMNLFWIAALSVFVLVEKTIPGWANRWVGRIAGLLLIAIGAWTGSAGFR